METETIDKLFLELSQVARAKTKKELDLQKKLNTAMDFIDQLKRLDFLDTIQQIEIRNMADDAIAKIRRI